MATKTPGTSPDKRRKYDVAFKAEALRLTSESRSMQAVARQLGISPKLLYRWQQAQLVAEVGEHQKVWGSGVKRPSIGAPLAVVGSRGTAAENNSPTPH